MTLEVSKGECCNDGLSRNLSHYLGAGATTRYPDAELDLTTVPDWQSLHGDDYNALVESKDGLMLDEAQYEQLAVSLEECGFTRYGDVWVLHPEQQARYGEVAVEVLHSLITVFADGCGDEEDMEHWVELERKAHPDCTQFGCVLPTLCLLLHMPFKQSLFVKTSSLAELISWMPSTTCSVWLGKRRMLRQR